MPHTCCNKAPCLMSTGLVRHPDQNLIEVADSGLFCRECDYNLTGLTGGRCPECGTDLDWDDLRRERERQARGIGIHWEHSRWYLRPIGFIATALQAALLPWILADGIPAHPRCLPALAFLATCIGVGSLAALGMGSDLAKILAWNIGVLCQVTLQTFLFGLILRPGGTRRPYRFWLIATSYTSYPLMLEGLSSPPFIFDGSSNIWPFSFLLGNGSWGPPWSGDPAVLTSLLYHLWWAGLATVAAKRLPRRSRWRAGLVLLAIPAMTCVSTYTGCQLSHMLS